MSKPRFYAIVLAAGTGKRFGSEKPKQYLPLVGKTLLEWSLKPFLESQWIEHIILVLGSEDAYWKKLPISQDKKITTVLGGAERADSCLNGLAKLSSIAKSEDWVLVHDAARPCLSLSLLEKLRDTLKDDPVGGILATPCADTLKKVKENRIVDTVDRSLLWQAQTPQMFRYGLLSEAYQSAIDKQQTMTDEASAVESLGFDVKIVKSERTNIKVTSPEDMSVAEHFLQEKNMSKPRFRMGHGYDAHTFVQGRKLVLGGVEIKHERGLLGHSDADVVLHAVSDALLGAAALGDIGRHFPDTDKKNKDADSREFLRRIKQLIHQEGFQIGNVDVTILAQAPKLLPYMEAMRKNIADDLELPVKDVNVKASTTEKMGFVGREEGIVAYAVVSLHE